MKATSPRFSVIFLTVFSLSLTSCFEITERLTLNKNGSGHMELTLNLQKMKSMLSMIGKSQPQAAERNLEAEDPLWSAKGEFDQKLAEISEIDGIHDVTLIQDTVSYVIGYGFDFDDIEALNQAMNIIVRQEDQEVGHEVFFEYKKRTLTRTESGQFDESLIRDFSNTEDIEGFRLFFEDMRYNTVYSFPRKVKNVSNESALMSPDGRTVEIAYYLFRPEENPDGITNTIRF